MRIAQVAPLWELVPPRTYGGTELVVHLLTEELVRRGHEVTLFAAKGTTTMANLVECAPMALREMEEKFKVDKTHCTVMAYELAMLGEVYRRASEFDVIHNHVGFQALPFADFGAPPTVTTLHNALNPEPVHQLYLQYKHLPYLSISNYQQQLWPELNYASTIYHGIDLARFRPKFMLKGEPYLAFLGRLSPEKGPHHAIRIAKALGMNLILAGKVDRVDQVFYDRELAHLIDGEQIRYIGEVNHAQKVELLRHAAATLCPIEWPEPFGLVMIESMACGTPVFALRDGSVPEVIDHGQSGFIADSVEALIEAVRDYRRFDRRSVREVAERRFSVQRMVDDHVALYDALIHKKSSANTGVMLPGMASLSPVSPVTDAVPPRRNPAKPMPRNPRPVNSIAGGAFTSASLSSAMVAKTMASGSAGTGALAASGATICGTALPAGVSATTITTAVPAANTRGSAANARKIQDLSLPVSGEPDLMAAGLPFATDYEPHRETVKAFQADRVMSEYSPEYTTGPSVS